MQPDSIVDNLSCMENGLTAWESKTAGLLLRWYIFLPLAILLTLAIHGMSLDDFPDPVAFVHFFPFSFAALVDQVWNGLWNFCRPTAMLIWRLGYALFGANYVGYRYIIFLLHITSICLFFSLARRVLKNDMAAVISGLLFATHPIHSEVVCLLASMYDASCMTFFLATLVLFDRYLEAIQERRRVLLLCLITCVFEVLCLGAKEVGIMLPVVMLAYALCLRASGRSFWASIIAAIKRSAPFLVILAGYLIFRLARYSQNVGYASRFFADPLGTLHNLGEYLRLTIFPNEMWIVLLIFLPFAKRQYIFSLLFMVLALVPVLQIPPAERFCYIPSAGYCLAVGWCFVIGWRRVAGVFGLIRRWHGLRSVGSVAALAIFALQIPSAYLNTCTWSTNYIPVRKTLQTIREVVGIPEPGTVLYLANLEPLFNLWLLNEYDFTVRDRFRCEKLINYVFEDHRGPEFFFEMRGVEALHRPELGEKCACLQSELGRQEYTTHHLAWGQGARPLSEWHILIGSSLGSDAASVEPCTGPTIDFDFADGPIKLLSPGLNISTLDVSSVGMLLDIGQSPDTTCQLEWVVLPEHAVMDNPAAVIPRYKEMKHPETSLSAPLWSQKKDDAPRKRTDQISIDLGSRTDWLFERRAIERIAIKFAGTDRVRILAIQFDPPGPASGPKLEPIIQFHEPQGQSRPPSAVPTQ